MAERSRIAIVGASTLLGKELVEELDNSVFAASSVTLLDADADGKLIEADGEVAVLHALKPDSFEGMDTVFFAGSAESTLEHWRRAREAGANLIDLTGALESEADVLVRAPGWLVAGATAERPSVATAAVVSAHPMAQALAAVAARLGTIATVEQVSATVLEPASAHGKAAMDELQQQAVALLSFKDMEKTQYDAQIAFNLVQQTGVEASISSAASEARIQSHYARLSTDLPPIDLQVIQAPVFHGYTASVRVELNAAVSAERVAAAMATVRILVSTGPEDAPSNIQASGEPTISVSISRTASAGASTTVWLWLAADNLKLAAINAIACALELRPLRPQGGVQ